MALCDYTENRDLLSAACTNVTFICCSGGCRAAVLGSSKHMAASGQDAKKEFPESLGQPGLLTELAQELGSGMGRKNILP